MEPNTPNSIVNPRVAAALSEYYRQSRERVHLKVVSPMTGELILEACEMQQQEKISVLSENVATHRLQCT